MSYKYSHFSVPNLRTLHSQHYELVSYARAPKGLVSAQHPKIPSPTHPQSQHSLSRSRFLCMPLKLMKRPIFWFICSQNTQNEAKCIQPCFDDMVNNPSDTATALLLWFYKALAGQRFQQLPLYNFHVKPQRETTFGGGWVFWCLDLTRFKWTWRPPRLESLNLVTSHAIVLTHFMPRGLFLKPVGFLWPTHISTETSGRCTFARQFQSRVLL